MPLHQIHTDTIHYSTLGVYGFRYSTYILDAYSGYHWIFFATSMADIAQKVAQWGNEVMNQVGNGFTIREIFMDGGKEFLRLEN
jgi:hypothetical protein